MSEDQEKPKREVGGTIGDLSIAVGQDVRELFIDGYSHEQVLGVAHGEMTSTEMRRQGPQNEPINTKEIMERVLQQRKGEK